MIGVWTESIYLKLDIFLRLWRDPWPGEWQGEVLHTHVAYRSSTMIEEREMKELHNSHGENRTSNLQVVSQSLSPFH